MIPSPNQARHLVVLPFPHSLARWMERVPVSKRKGIMAAYGSFFIRLRAQQQKVDCN
jgi:hypothetical protein